MSELTTCNYCNLLAIERQAKKDNLKVIKRRSTSTLGGHDIYLVPKQLSVPLEIVACTEEVEGDSFHDKYFVSWMMEIPDHCCC